MKISRSEMAERIAERLLEYADTQELERVYFDVQHEWADTLPDVELLETAERLNILDEGYELET